MKYGDEELSDRIWGCKRDKDFHGLQIYFRKYLQKFKEDFRFGGKRGFTPLSKIKPQT